jgi:hypothetical protein
VDSCFTSDSSCTASRKMREYEEQRLKENEAQFTPSHSVSSSIGSPEVQTLLEKKMFVLSELIRVSDSMGPEGEDLCKKARHEYCECLQKVRDIINAHLERLIPVDLATPARSSNSRESNAPHSSGTLRAITSDLNAQIMSSTDSISATQQLVAEHWSSNLISSDEEDNFGDMRSTVV